MLPAVDPPDVIRPRYLWMPERRGSLLAEVEDVAELIGRPLDAEQSIMVDAKTSLGRGGKWATLETCLKEPRQNGKTAGVETPIVITDLFTGPPDRIAWSAHLFKTTRDTFADHVRLIQSCPDLDRQVAKIRFANGEEAIILKNGAMIEYLARSKGGGRGLGGRRVVIDEALFFTSEQAGALLPVTAARDNPQVDYLSSACKVESSYLRDLTVRGRAMDDPDLIFIEYCAPGGFNNPGCQSENCMHTRNSEGCTLDREDYAREANPATRPGRINISFLKSMRRALGSDPTEFAREFFGWDEDAAGDADVDTIPEDAWAARVQATSKVKSGGRVALSVDIPPDRRSASIAIAGWRADGDVHAALVRRQAGTAWVIPELLALISRHRPVALVLDGASQAAGMVDDLTRDSTIKRRSVEDPSGLLVVTSLGDMASACTMLYDAVAGDAPYLWHREDVLVDDALVGAARRDVGDGRWAFRRRTSTADISPLVAIAEALYGLRTAPVDQEPLVMWA